MSDWLFFLFRGKVIGINGDGFVVLHGGHILGAINL